MPTYKNPGKLSFTAPIQTNNKSVGGSWVDFPWSVEDKYGVKGRVPVKATFDGVPYTGSLCKMGPGPHTLLIRKEIRALITKGGGDKVRVTVELDAGERTVDVPPALTAALCGAPGGSLLPKFEAMSFTCRKEYAAWVADAKKDETRERRLAKAVEMIAAGKKFS